ncbi:MAG: hypothetical protein IT495_05205 [Gammaproteobacteria bacterium]|nr:hypothetical protein [Gammaproteobacteria bacterium]
MNQVHRIVALELPERSLVQIDADAMQRGRFALYDRATTRWISTYVSWGGIRAMIGWHNPDVALDPK